MNPLPHELYNLIAKHLDEDTLFRIIMLTQDAGNSQSNDEVRNIPISLAYLTDIARLTLFNRVSDAAFKYQNDFLKSWIKHYSLHHTFSFIKTHQQKKTWLKLLLKAVNNQNITEQHKAHCLIFILKLFPRQNDISASIAQQIITNITNPYSPSGMLTLFGSIFMEQDIEKILNQLLSKLDKSNQSHWDPTFIYRLSDLVPYLDQTQRNRIFKTFNEHFNYHSVNAAYDSLIKFVRYANAEQRALLLKDAFFRLNSISIDFITIAIRLFIALIPYINQFDRERICSSLIEKFKTNHPSYVYSSNEAIKYIADAFIKLMPHLNQEARDSILDICKKKFKDKALVRTIKALTPYLNQNQRSDMFSFFVSQMNEHNTRDSAKKGIKAFAPYITCEEHNRLIASNLEIILDKRRTLKHQCAFETLKAMTPYISLKSRKSLFLSLMEKASHPNEDIREDALEWLNAFIPLFSDGQCADILELLSMELNQGNADIHPSSHQTIIIILAKLVHSMSDHTRARIYQILQSHLQLDEPGIRWAIMIFITAMVPYTKVENHRELFNIFTAQSNASPLYVFQEAMNIIEALAQYANDALHMPLFLHAVNQLDNKDETIRTTAVSIIETVFLRVKAQHQPAMIANLSQRLIASSGHYQDALIDIFETIIPSLQEELHHELMTVLTQYLNHQNENIRIVAAKLLTPLPQKLSLSHLNTILKSTDSAPIILMAKLHAQIRINLYTRPDWEPRDESGIQFSYNSQSHDLTESIFNETKKDFDVTRTLHLWSKVGNKKWAADDCFTIKRPAEAGL